MSARATLDADEDAHDDGGDGDDGGVMKMKIDDDEDYELTRPNDRIDRTSVTNRRHDNTKP